MSNSNAKAAALQAAQAAAAQQQQQKNAAGEEAGKTDNAAVAGAADAAAAGEQAPVDENADASKGTDTPATDAGAQGTDAAAKDDAPNPIDEAPASTVVETSMAAAAKVQTTHAVSRGQIAPPAVRSAPVGTVISAPKMPSTTKPEQVSAEVDLAEEVKRILVDVPSANHIPLYGILKYCKEADLGNGNTPQNMAKLNQSLWISITNLINNQDQYFEPMFAALLRVFALAGKNALSEISVNRGAEYMTLSKQALSGYFNLTTMLRLTADPKSRKQMLKTGLNLKQSLSNGLTADGIARVVTYFETH